MTNTILKFSFLCFIVLGFLACQNNSTNANTSAEQLAREDSLELKLNIKSYKKVEISQEVDSLVKNWPIYEDFKNEVNRFNNYSIQDVISNLSTVERVIDSLQRTIPKKVDTFPVVSRIKVLNTKAKYMLLLSEKQKPKLNPIMRMAEEFPLEFNALNIQLNEVFIRFPDFE